MPLYKAEIPSSAIIVRVVPISPRYFNLTLGSFLYLITFLTFVENDLFSVFASLIFSIDS